MKKIMLENGKEVSISDERYKALSDNVTDDFEVNNDIAIVNGYKLVCELGDRKKVRTTVMKDRQVYVNQVFADNSVFGSSGVFINCNFGSYCEFGSDCEFGSCCKFGSNCKFCSNCEFGSYCEFDSNCKKQLPYWDETGKHNW